ncbi:hypothetical protein NEDG_01932 [Nematocida displodere]|uniref:Hypoxia up-regulated 1 n=1 Tax=Nematocida displodere TaxID=1805483 RepID=A0A177EHF8_9MICR|nr:hypothetical protein NEDG_01932 [Nematocida displodere]
MKVLLWSLVSALAAYVSVVLTEEKHEKAMRVTPDITIFGIDDSVLKPTISVKRYIVIEPEATKQDILGTKGIEMSREGVRPSNKIGAIYNPLSLIMETKEELEKAHPFLKIREEKEGRVFKFDHLYTEIPDLYLYGSFLKQKIESRKKPQEFIPRIYLTSRGYATREQREKLGKALIETNPGVNTAIVVPDGTSLAIHTVAPCTRDRVVQTYVFRGSKVVSSLFRFTAQDKEKKQKKTSAGKLKNLYHNVHDIFDEKDVLTMISEFLQAKVAEMVEAYKPNTYTVQFYPDIGHIQPKAPATDQTHYFNLVVLANKVLAELNNNAAFSPYIEFPELILMDGEGAPKATIVPAPGQGYHKIEIAELKARVEEFVISKSGMIEKMVADSEEANKKHSQPEDTIETVVYHDLLTESLFLEPLRTFFPEDAIQANKAQITGGSLQIEHWSIDVEDAQKAELTRRSISKYQINNKTKTVSSINPLLKEEEEMANAVIGILSKHPSDKQVADTKSFTQEEQKTLEEELNQIRGPETIHAFKKSPGMIEAIAKYKQVIQKQQQREETVTSIKSRTTSIMGFIKNAEDLFKETLPIIPEVAEDLQKFTQAKTEEIKLLQESTQDEKTLKALEKLDRDIGYKLRLVQNKLNEYFQKKQEEENRLAEEQAQAATEQGLVTEQSPTTDQDPTDQDPTDQDLTTDQDPTTAQPTTAQDPTTAQPTTEAEKVDFSESVLGMNDKDSLRVDL